MGHRRAGRPEGIEGRANNARSVGHSSRKPATLRNLRKDNMSFQLPAFTPVTLSHLNVRAEMAGKEPVPAVDMKFTLTGSNNLLEMFDAGLKGVLYKPADATWQPDLDGVDPATDMPALRSSSIEMPISLNKDYIGRNLVVDFGLGGSSNIELSGCDVDNFKVNCIEGGSVEISFRVQASGLNDKALGTLGTLVKHSVQITLMSSPEADGTQEKIPDAPNPFKFSVVEGGVKDNNPVDVAPEAGDVFAAAVEAGDAPPVDAKSKKKAKD